MATYSDSTLVLNGGLTTKMSASDQLAYSLDLILADGKGLAATSGTTTLAMKLGNDAATSSFAVNNNSGVSKLTCDATGNVTIAGNLDVSGNIISRDEERVLVADNFLDVNFGSTSTVALAGGLAVNYQAVSGKILTINTAANTMTFAAATGETEPTLSVATTNGIPASTFSAGDIVQVAGTTNAENDGFYVCNDNSAAGTVDFKSTLTTTPDTINFKPAQVNFTAASQTSGSVTIAKIKATILQVKVSNGTWETATGNTDADFSSPGDLGGSTLQEAYDLGSTITTDVSGTIAFTLSADNQGLSVNGSGASTGNVQFGNSATIQTFTVDSGGAVSLDSAAASNFTTSAGALTLTSAAAATWSTGAGILGLSGAGGVTVTSTGGTLTLNGTGQTVDLNAAGLDIDSTAASRVTTTGASLDIETVTSGALAVTSAGTLACTGAAVSTFGDDVAVWSFDGAGALSETGMTSASVTPSAAITLTAGAASTWSTSAGALTLTSAAAATWSTAAGALSLTGAGGVTVTSTGGTLALNGTGQTVDLNAAGLDIDSTAASRVTTTGASLDIETVTSGALAVTSAGTLACTGASTSTFGDDTAVWSFDGSGALSTSGMTTVDLDASGQVQVNSSGGAISVGNDANNQAINIGTGGTRTVTVGSNTATGRINVLDNTANAFQLQGGGTPRVSLNTTNNVEELGLDASLNLQKVDGSGALTASATAGEALAIGDILAYDFSTNSRVFKSDPSTAQKCNAAGVCTSAASNPADATKIAVHGIVTATFDGNVATSNIGDLCYAAETAGKASLTAPSTAGDRIYKLGIVVGAAGSASAQVLLQPQFIADLAS